MALVSKDSPRIYPRLSLYNPCGLLCLPAHTAQSELNQQPHGMAAILVACSCEIIDLSY
jgi:hypothetical protein